MIRSTAHAVTKGATYLARHPLLALALLLGVLVALDVLAPESAWAGPGGQFVKVLAKTWWGKLLFGLLALVFLPLIAYVTIREWIEVRRCRRDLDALGAKLPYFAWSHIEDRAQRAMKTLYDAWGRGDLSPAAPYTTAEFLEGQQDMLDRWKEEGKENVFELRGDISLAPLHVMVETADTRSAVYLRCKAKVVDYLANILTHEKIKGNESVEELETCLLFLHVDGEWLLHSIDEGSNSLAIATEKNRLDASYLLGMAETSQLAGADGAQHPAAAQAEAGAVGVAEGDESEREVGEVREG